MNQSVPERNSPEWAEWAAAHPLHKAVIGQVRKGDIQLRVDQMVDWIGSGLPRSKRIRKAQEHWGIKIDRCDQIIKLANAQIRAHWQSERPDFMAEQLDRLENLYLLAVERNQLNVAQGCLNSMQRMTGCDGAHRPPSIPYRPDRVRHG